jgi:hypothetical protein
MTMNQHTMTRMTQDSSESTTTTATATADDMSEPAEPQAQALLDSSYAKDKKTLMELMNKLRSTGLNDDGNATIGRVVD